MPTRIEMLDGSRKGAIVLGSFFLMAVGFQSPDLSIGQTLPYVDITSPPYSANGGDKEDDTQAIKKAIKDIEETGGTVFFPVGEYIISQTINIGDGSSERGHNVKLLGSRTGGIYKSNKPAGSTLVWKGCKNETMLHANVVIGASIEGIRFHADSLAGIALHLENVRASTFKDIAIVDPLFYAIKGDVIKTVWAGSRSNHFEQIYIDLKRGGMSAVGISLDGALFYDEKRNPWTPDWHLNSFMNGIIQLETKLYGKQQVGIELKIADSNTFYEFDVYKSHDPAKGEVGNGYGIKFISTWNGFPLNNTFYNCSIQGGFKVEETDISKVGKNFFIPFPTQDWEEEKGFPSPLTGFTDDMRFLNTNVTIDGGNNWGQLLVRGKTGADLRLIDPDAPPNAKELLIRSQEGKSQIMSVKDPKDGRPHKYIITLDNDVGDVSFGSHTTNGYPIFAANANGALLTRSGVWQDASSKEYKQNISELTFDEASNTLAGLRPVRFNYTVEPDEEYIGFIAEEVPDLVASENRKTLSAMDIVAVLTKVVQNQQQMLENQQNQINALRQEILKLKKE